MSPLAAASLITELASELATLLAPVLYEIFAQRVPNPEAGEGGEQARPIASYDAFVEYMRQQGFSLLFVEKPVLLRLLAVVTAQWIEATAEFLNRLHDDETAITELIGIECEVRIDSTVVTGDLHNHGRAVRLVTLISGHRILYKPKDLSVDGALSTLILRLNATDTPYSQRVPRTIARDQYGWTEFIEFAPCTCPDDLALYFRRAGGWLCLFHVLGGVDMHEQNIIACGSFPVPVDLETLFQPSAVPDVAEQDPRKAYTLVSRDIATSVLATGLLPGYGKLAGQEAIAHGGFVATRDQKRVIHWSNMNSDHMRPEERWVLGSKNENLPNLDGRPARIQDFLPHVVAGYRQYAAFLSRTVKRVGAQAFVEPFRGLTVRKILKNTRFYSLLIDRLKDPRRMQDGAIWSAQLDFVSRLANWNDEEDPWWPLVRAERAALSQLNVPYFLMDTCSPVIRDVDGVQADSALEPGLSRVLTALQTLDDTEIERQVEIIRVSLSSIRPVAESLDCRAARRARAAGRRHELVGDEGFRFQATEIAGHIASRAYRASGSAAWCGLDWLQDSSVCQIAPVGGDLYNGAPGICVFLAAQAKVGNDREAASLAKAGIAALRSDLLGPNGGRAARALGVGGATGLGSVIYAFAVIAQLTNDRDLLSDAESITQFVTDELIADAGLDVMDGVAGTLLSLIKLQRLTGSAQALERAITCSRHIVRALESAPGAENAPDGAGSLVTGMSHGGAGIAYALLSFAMAAELAVSDNIVHAARMLLSAENAMFCAERGNWPDSRAAHSAAKDFWPSQWCHGAAGIGLARIATAKVLRTAPGFDIDVNCDVERAVRAVIAAWPYGTDSLCCGSLGGIELLHEAAAQLRRPELAKLARSRLSEIIREAYAEGDFLWDISDRSLNVGLYRGIAGVGYVALRQVDPSLPNILSWE